MNFSAARAKFVAYLVLFSFASGIMGGFFYKENSVIQVVKGVALSRQQFVAASWYLSSINPALREREEEFLKQVSYLTYTIALCKLEAQRLRFSISDKAVTNFLRNSEMFFDENGKFSIDKFYDIIGQFSLKGQGVNEKEFVDGVRDLLIYLVFIHPISQKIDLRSDVRALVNSIANEKSSFMVFEFDNSLKGFFNFLETIGNKKFKNLSFSQLEDEAKNAGIDLPVVSLVAQLNYNKTAEKNVIEISDQEVQDFYEKNKKNYFREAVALTAEVHCKNKEQEADFKKAIEAGESFASALMISGAYEQKEEEIDIDKLSGYFPGARKITKSVRYEGEIVFLYLKEIKSSGIEPLAKVKDRVKDDIFKQKYQEKLARLKDFLQRDAKNILLSGVEKFMAKKKEECFALAKVGRGEFPSFFFVALQKILETSPNFYFFHPMFRDILKDVKVKLDFESSSYEVSLLFLTDNEAKKMADKVKVDSVIVREKIHIWHDVDLAVKDRENLLLLKKLIKLFMETGQEHISEIKKKLEAKSSDFQPSQIEKILQKSLPLFIKKKELKDFSIETLFKEGFEVDMILNFLNLNLGGVVVKDDDETKLTKKVFWKVKKEIAKEGFADRMYGGLQYEPSTNFINYLSKFYDPKSASLELNDEED